MRYIITATRVLTASPSKMQPTRHVHTLQYIQNVQLHNSIRTDLSTDSRPYPGNSRLIQCWSIFSARCNIYISRLCYDVSIRLSVTEVHWRIIANLGSKFRSKFTAHCGRGIIAGKSGRIISRYASHC